MNNTIKYALKCMLGMTFVGNILSCHTEKEREMEINWSQLPVNGLNGDLQKGVSASYAALIDTKLIVAGGANFPDKFGFEGGSKAFYDEILQFDPEQGKWNIIGHLPQPGAYGVSVSLPEGMLWIGGNTPTESLSTCYKVLISENQKFEIQPFVRLPVTMDNFSGCAVDNRVFVGGGNVEGKPSNKFYSIHAGTDSAWTALPDFPGLPRVQPVMVAIQKEKKQYIYLLGGFFGGDAAHKPSIATDILRYDIGTQQWEVVGEQTDSETGNRFSLGGATAMPIDNKYILCLGGVNYQVFLDAITRQYTIGSDISTSVDEKATLNREFSQYYMTQPVEYYQFNPECRIYDVETNEWKTIDSTPNTARAGATLVWDNTFFYVVQGEVKPGVRSSETWKGEILFR